MTVYRAPIPFSLAEDDIDRLRGLGGVRLEFIIEAPSRVDAIRSTADEMQGYHPVLGEREWWDEHLSGRRSRGDSA